MASGCGVTVAYLRNPLKEKHSHVDCRVMEWKTTENWGNFKQRAGLYCSLCYNNQRRPRRLVHCSTSVTSPVWYSYDFYKWAVNRSCNIVVHTNTRMPVTFRKRRVLWVANSSAVFIKTIINPISKLPQTTCKLLSLHLLLRLNCKLFHVSAETYLSSEGETKTRKGCSHVQSRWACVT